MHKPIQEFINHKRIGYSGNKTYIEHFVLYQDGSNGYLYSEQWIDEYGFIKQSIMSENYPCIKGNNNND